MRRLTLLLIAVLSIAWAPPAKEPPKKPIPDPAKPAPGTTVQLPQFGIAIDAAGELSLKSLTDPTGRLHRERIEAARAALHADLQRESPLRKVSLVKLERALRARLEDGQPPEDAMLRLAGLQRVQFVFCYPAADGGRGDIVLAGPAEGWVQDAAGRAVGIGSGQPTVELVDLAAAVRLFPPGKKSKTFLGCTIDPVAEGLERLRQFQQRVPSSVKPNERGEVARFVAEGTRDALGLAQIRTFGVSTRTHFAHVLVEADYRMKRIGIGAEPPPVRMASFLDLSQTGVHGTLQRWWFTPDYKCLRLAADRRAAELVGQGVKLQTENMVIGPGGTLMGGGAPSRASELFTAGFTAKYPEIAARSPVYAQLRTLVDLAIVAALAQRHDYYGQAKWQATLLCSEERFPLQTEPEMKTVPAVVNAVWRRNRLLAPAGGGVSINAHLALESENLLADDEERLPGQRDAASSVRPGGDAWWWD